jgi:hypothetical protein
MKIRVKIGEIVRQMSLSIAILSGFMAYDIGKGNWTGVWIILGALVFLILMSWLLVNALIEWMEKRKGDR